MADFVAVLRKTLDGLGETTPEVRARVYDKARSTIAAKLAALNPTPPASVAERQKRALEDAIRQVEDGYAKPAAPVPADPLAELENIFSSIDRNRNQPNHARPGAAAAPAARPDATPAPKSQPAAHAPQPKREEPKPAPADPAWKKTSPTLAATLAPAAADKADAEEKPPAAPAFDDDFAESQGQPVDPWQDEPGRRRGYRGLIAAVIALAVIAGGGYGVWLNKAAFADMFGLGKTETAQVQPAETPEPAETAKADTDKTGPSPSSPAPASSAPANGESQKFTQRLMPDGKEVDPGPAGGESHIGEGSSVVALTTPPPGTPTADAPATDTQDATPPPAAATDGTTAPAAPASTTADQPALAVGQKAIFYEERTNTADGSAEPGSIVWSLAQESPGGDAPAEPAIRAEVTIPGKDMQLRMTIRRNTDKTLPASHIIEMIFLTPDGFEGGGIDNVLRIAMKSTEQEAGSPLIGIPAKIADGFFLVALNDTKADEDANLTLLRNQDWIDIPVVYKSGRRALLTMEKGIPGDKVFDDAMKAWQAKTAG
jgi:hypothetical protein